MYPPSFLKSFRWKLCLALAIAMLGDQFFYRHALHGGHIGLFALAVLLCLILGRPGMARQRQAGFAILSALVFGGALILDPGPLAWTLFWVSVSMAALLRGGVPFDDGWLWFQRLFLHAARSPAAPFIDARRLARAWRRPRSGRLGLRTILPVVALPLGGSAVILALFATANPIIANMLAMIALPDLSSFPPGRLVIWFLTFALGWSLLRARAARRLIPTFDGSGDMPIAGVSIASVTLSLILFNLLFAVENMLDIAYLSRALPLPRGMGMAEYVHRGAYPLIVTALLAGLFVLVTLRPGSSTAHVPAIRRLVVLWIAQNVILVASSIQRTLDYIDVSMFTALRIHALAWMALVACGLMLICWRMLREKSASWLINANLLLAGMVLGFFCFFDAGEAAAWWNVRHAREITGKGPALDLCYLRRLGPSALLPLIELESRPLPRPFRERVQWVRMTIHAEMIDADRHGGWTLRNERRLAAARERLSAVRPVPLTPGDRDCQAMLLPPRPVPAPVAAPVDAPTPTPAPALTERVQR